MVILLVRVHDVHAEQCPGSEFDGEQISSSFVDHVEEGRLVGLVLETRAHRRFGHGGTRQLHGVDVQGLF